MQKFKVMLTAFTIAVALTALAVGSTIADAAIVPNTATGDIAGSAADLDTTGSTFTLDITTMALVKRAFLADGTQLSSGDQVPKGTTVQFMLYVDNPTSGDLDTLNVVDVLDGAFAYQTGTIAVDTTTVSSGGWTEADLYNTVTTTGTPITDAVTVADEGGFDTVDTISAGDGAGNKMLTVPRNKVWVMIFEVKTQ